jgi:hypothetical protein
MKVTKGALYQFIRTKLSTSDIWAKAALLEIFAHQTADEQNAEATSHNNNVGFTGADARFLSSLAKQAIGRGWLSPKQMIYVRKKMPKYAGQVMSYSNPEKLKAAYLKSIQQTV